MIYNMSEDYKKIIIDNWDRFGKLIKDFHYDMKLEEVYISSDDEKCTIKCVCTSVYYTYDHTTGSYDYLLPIKEIYSCSIPSIDMDKIMMNIEDNFDKVIFEMKDV